MTINVSDSTAKLLLSSKQFDLEKLELEVFEVSAKHYTAISHCRSLLLV